MRPTKPFWETNETILKQAQRSYSPTDGGKDARRPYVNHSFHSADRSTHLKIVAVALVAGIAVVGFGIAARNSTDFTQTAQTTHVVKAGKPVIVTSSERSAIR